MLPRVILRKAVSLDGKVDGFPIDLQQFYELASIWKEDATLAGPNTILKGAYDAPPEDDCALLPPVSILMTVAPSWPCPIAA
jgi:2,5-diamino-6-(ribosylamino)-4(3H)-pyrimidinone 5'-phosphate reductase